MKASKENPIYSVYIVGGSKYNVTGAVVGIELSDQEKQLAQCANINIMNTKVNGKKIADLIEVRDRVFVYANDGSKNDEVFRGYVWTKTCRTGLKDLELTLKCYDNLIYLQESEDSEYFTSGKSSDAIISALASKWGISVDYSYESITHAKLALRGKLANIIMSDVLDLVKDRTGKDYLIRSEKDAMKIMVPGSNSTSYTFKAKQNVTTVRSECTMDGMITKVVIVSKADDQDEREPVEATVTGNTGKYGTLQKVITRDENTELEEAKAEAQAIVDKEGKPKWEYEVKATDVPWIRKGDKVTIDAADVKGSLLVVSVEHSISSKTKEITMTLRKE